MWRTAPVRWFVGRNGRTLRGGSDLLSSGGSPAMRTIIGALKALSPTLPSDSQPASRQGVVPLFGELRVRSRMSAAFPSSIIGVSVAAAREWQAASGR